MTISTTFSMEQDWGCPWLFNTALYLEHLVLTSLLDKSWKSSAEQSETVLRINRSKVFNSLVGVWSIWVREKVSSDARNWSLVVFRVAVWLVVIKMTETDFVNFLTSAHMTSHRLFHAPTRMTSSGCFVLHRNLYGNPYRNRAEKEEKTVTW